MINLVPPEIRQRKNLKSLAYIITTTYVLILSVLALSWAGLSTYNYTQKVYLGNQQSEIDRLDAEKNKDRVLQSQAALIQNRLNNAATYQSSHDWEQVLDAIAESTPTTTSLTSIKAAVVVNKPPTVTVTGQSPDRRSIILFKDRLAVTNPFESVSITALTDTTTANNDASSKSPTSGFTFTISINIGKTK